VSLVKKDLPKQCCEKNRPNCCSNKVLTVKTDPFSLNRTDQDIPAPVVPHPVFFTANTDLVYPCENSLFLQHVFPPGGLARYSAELRHLICIYRI
jgi:hypothetical protein